MTNVRNLFKRRLGKLYPRYSHITILLLLLGLSNFAFSQTTALVLKGKIVDEQTKEVLIGASVRVKGTILGAITDINGEFQLSVKQELPVTLVSNSIGYKYQEIEVYENEPLSILLAEDANRLSSVVVVGYGTKKREELTGSISSISLTSIKQSSVTSLDNALQGRATGVQVTQASGSPGGAVSIRIRGGNSITGGNEPLYVIDGFPVYNDNSTANAGALNGPSVNALASINPGDIESIDVLKDASATAIYGSRGANGVVIVTTKKGKAGQGSVTYDGSYGVQSVTKTIDLLNANQWATLKNDAVANTNTYVRLPAGLAPKALPFSQGQLDSLSRNNNDWQKAAFRNAAVQSHQLTFSGGTDKTKYSFSLGRLDQKGILTGTDFVRNSARVAVDSRLYDRLNVGVNLNASNSDAHVVSYGNGTGTDIISAILLMPPTVPVKDAKGNYTLKSPYESSVANPIATLNESTNESKVLRLLGTAFAELEITKGLKAKVLVGTDILNNKQNRYLPATLLEGASVGGVATIGSRLTTNWLNENTLTYNTTINKDHNLDLLAGYTQQQSASEGYVAGSQGYANDALTYNDLGSGSNINKPSSSASGWTLLSYLGRVNYNYNQKYFLTGSIRADGSSRLGANNRWGYFPSAAIGWQVNKESFLEGAKGYLSNLKLRLSAGKTGNQEIAPYQSQAILSGYSYPTSSGSLTGFAPSQIANANLKWETTNQYDIGVDLGLFDERVRLVFDAYYKKTSDLLLNVPLPATSGFTTSLQNVGSVQNKGIEIGLNTDNIRGKFNWSTDVSFSLNRNEVLSIGNGRDYYLVPGELQTGSVIKVGQPLGSFWGFKTNGLIRSSDDLSKTLLFAPNSVTTGDVKYVDVNGDGKITQAGDQTIIGNAQPKFIYGIGNNFSYSNFDLAIFFQGSYGSKIYSNLFQQLELPTGFKNGIAGLADHYTAANDAAQYQRANENLPATPNSDLFVFDGSYLRLKTVSLGYSLPKSLLSKLKVNKLRLYVTAQNIYTWTSYKGYDPEVNYFDGNSSRQGVDASSYPNSKTFLGGVSLTF